jgi:hypothetical protein
MIWEAKELFPAGVTTGETNIESPNMYWGRVPLKFRRKNFQKMKIQYIETME